MRPSLTGGGSPPPGPTRFWEALRHPKRLRALLAVSNRHLSALTDGEVRFILIGGMAAILHGDVGLTVDIDVVPELTDENLARLAEALRGLGARIRTEGVPGGALVRLLGGSVAHPDRVARGRHSFQGGCRP
jgi:hypothetical protein